MICDTIPLQDKDADKINHRIPHRFEPITSMSPSWCCHCGQIVPLSRKKARKCSGRLERFSGASSSVREITHRLHPC